MLAVLDSPRFADKSPGQVWAILLDEGTYLRSEATMYRLLRERGQSGERRAQATRPAKKKPELMADGPNQVWSWDITKLKGPARGVFYLLYVIIDIFSRKVIWWDIWPAETGTLAKEFIERAIEDNGGIRPGAVHADRGTSMTSNTVAGLLATLGIDQSHSRPHVSNDNPYSRPVKTLKTARLPGSSAPSRPRVFCTHSSVLQQRAPPFRIAMHTPAPSTTAPRQDPRQAHRHPQAAFLAAPSGSAHGPTRRHCQPELDQPATSNLQTTPHQNHKQR